MLSRIKARRLDLNSGILAYGHGEGIAVSQSVSEWLPPKTDLLEKVGTASKEGLASSGWINRAWAYR